MLFLYAVCFSFAYISLETGTGALVLFGTVQLTIFAGSLLAGHRPMIIEWLGTFISFSGLVYLVLPDTSSPSLTGFLLMAMAGMAWGVYTLNGRGSADPIRDTTGNFVYSIPFAAMLFAAALLVSVDFKLSVFGMALAVLSGAIASGVGYTIWYIALREISTIESAVVQLSVPVIAAFGGVAFVAEPITQRLLIASILTLGGILLVILGRQYWTRQNQAGN